MKNTQTTTVSSENVLRAILTTMLIAFGSLAAPANAQTACQLTLTWLDNSNNEDGFKIERAATALGPWTQIAQLPPSITSYQDAGLIATWIYYYRIRAYNAVGDSAYSNVASGSPPCPGATDTVGDGIPDLWRQAYFGGSGITTNSQSCATCDADRTGQNNQFKYESGLDPTNSASVFVVQIQSVVGQPNQKNLIFKPIAAGRAYTVETRTDLVTGSYVVSPNLSGPQTNANQVTITDLNATQSTKFYRVHISIL
jgi:hypothetical protein